MIAYFDTSAVVPLLVEEPGSEVCLRVFLQADSVATIRMTSAEPPRHSPARPGSAA